MQETVYIAQGFRREGRRKQLTPDQPRRCRSPQDAIKAAEQLAGRRIGAVAYSINVDHDTDFADEPVILFKAGELPPELADE